ncbi:MAG TPA: zinc-dependent metalloprotease [Acidimicrobiales bacterium]|nr:zinc-dependent metalloprotease [Acidimicrobiales bacterium]
MSDFGPMEGGGPLEKAIRDLARMLTSQGPINWEFARQLALMTASEGETEPNPDPLARVRLEELLRVAELHVAEATGLTAAVGGGLLSVRAVTRSDWALRTLQAWKPLLETLATALGRSVAEDAAIVETPTDPMARLLGNLPQALAPLLFGIQVGSMVGQLATRAMGQYDLPVPRPPGDDLLMVPVAIDGFAQDWSLAVDDVRLWVCLHEVTHHAVLSRPHVRERLDSLMRDYVNAFEPNAAGLEDRLTMFDPTDLSSLQQTFSSPEVLLGEMQSDAQRQVMVPLTALLSAVVGYVDHVMDTVGHRLIASYGPLTEAMRRRRLEGGEGSEFVARLLGVSLDGAAYERGTAFVKGVVERAGEEGLARLWNSARELPTPAEIAAPGLWLARIDLPDD